MKFGKKKEKTQPAAENQGKGSGSDPAKQQPSEKPDEKEVVITTPDIQKAEGKAKNQKSAINLKIFIIGLPLFIIQVAAVYFITANILMSRSASNKPEDAASIVQPPQDSAGNIEIGKHIFLIEDIIVNPSGSEGERLLLTSLGFDTKDEESQKELKSKEVVVKDLIITTFSSKTWEQLNNSSFKDSLKIELYERIRRLMPGVKLNTIYFSKYIAQ